jgi:hypothetical protein
MCRSANVSTQLQLSTPLTGNLQPSNDSTMCMESVCRSMCSSGAVGAGQDRASGIVHGDSNRGTGEARGTRERGNDWSDWPLRSANARRAGRFCGLPPSRRF